MTAVPESDPARERLWVGARLATLAPGLPGLGVIEAGAVAARDGRIVYVGPEADAPQALRARAQTIRCEGRWITPGLIDCHTHLVHAGDRAGEFEARLRGATYEEIARAGGGIVSSVAALRAASEDDLLCQSLPRLDALLAEGVTTIEIKSGYGLDLPNERKALRAATRLGEARRVRVRRTYLGAHALPPEAAGDRAAYLAAIVAEALPALAREGLVDAVDGFCETIAFSAPEIAQVFDAARARAAGQAARRPALQPPRRRARRALRRFVRRSSRTYGRGRSGGDGRRGDDRGAVAGRLLFHSRDPQAADRPVPAPSGPDGGGDRLQSRDLADDLAAARDEHGGDAVPHDRR